MLHQHICTDACRLMQAFSMAPAGFVTIRIFAKQPDNIPCNGAVCRYWHLLARLAMSGAHGQDSCSLCCQTFDQTAVLVWPSNLDNQASGSMANDDKYAAASSSLKHAASAASAAMSAGCDYALLLGDDVVLHTDRWLDAVDAAFISIAEQAFKSNRAAGNVEVRLPAFGCVALHDLSSPGMHCYWTRSRE